MKKLSNLQTSNGLYSFYMDSCTVYTAVYIFREIFYTLYQHLWDNIVHTYIDYVMYYVLCLSSV